MPTPEVISSEKQKLYESPSLRDDLNDNEATILLEWGESQVDRLATDFPDEFEAKTRFLRQLIKNINRFVGQREFNEREGQEKYMKKIAMYLEPLGWDGLSGNDLFNVLPDDKANMFANLMAIIRVLSPQEATLVDHGDASKIMSSEKSVTRQENHLIKKDLVTEAETAPDEPAEDSNNPIVELEQSAEKIVEDIIDPIFSAETYESIDAEDIDDKNDIVAGNTESERTVSNDEDSNNSTLSKLFRGFLNHGEEEKE